MSTPSSIETRYGIYDPETKLYVKKGCDIGWAVHWTDRPDRILGYKKKSDINKLYLWVAKDHPGVELVEVVITYSVSHAPLAAPTIEDVHRKTLELYRRLLPLYETDVDSMSQKDYDDFMKVKNKVRDLGFPVPDRPR